MISINSLEIFKQNIYLPTDIGLVSNNTYLSIVVTNACQRKCFYCINSETDQSLELPIDKAITNIKTLVEKYKIKEAILLGGEPTIHSNLFSLIKKLRTETELQIIRLTTNGIKLINNPDFIEKLVDKNYGIQGLNISFHNEDFMSYQQLEDVCKNVRFFNSNIKIRINTNIWKDNLDDFNKIYFFTKKLKFVDEFRISNLIPKDSFSVNSKNNKFIGLTVEEYNNLFHHICNYFSKKYTLIENKETLGFVKYVLIPTKTPIIINWNTSSNVSDQICENDINTKKINTFKCLVNGDISLSWNELNTIKIN